MPKHDISLTLDFNVGDRVIHPTDGEGVIDCCEIRIKAKNKAAIYYIVDLSRGSEFRVLRKYTGCELRLQAEG